MSLQCLYDCRRERNFPPACTGFRRTEMPHEAGLRNHQRLADEVYPFPSQRQNFTNTQPRHGGKQNDGAGRFITGSNETLDFIEAEKLMRAFQRSLGHFHTTNDVVCQVVPIDSGSEHLAHQISEMVGSLPCESLFEFFQKVVLDLNSGNVAKALITKPRGQVFPQEKRINLLGCKLECRQYSRLEAF